MRFGAFVPQGWRMDLVGVPPEEHWPTMINTANQIEKAGYESAWVYDHFHTVPEPTQEPTYEAWTLMAALAASTERIRLGQMCTCNSYRLPSYMAKVASSVDVISGGRLEFAIGAGWYEHEYLAYGYEFPKASVRIGQLREAVEIIKAMWTEDEPSLKGEYFAIDGAINQPKPLQRPRVPVMVGGNGPKQDSESPVLRGAELNLDGLDPAAVAEALPVIRSRCEKIGRDPASLKVSVHTWYQDPGVSTPGHERQDLFASYAALGLARVQTYCDGFYLLCQFQVQIPH